MQTGLIGCGIAVMYYALKTNPNETDFLDSVTESRLKLILVGGPTQKPTAVQLLHRLTDAFSHDVIRRVNLVFCSVLWRDDYSTDCCLFEAQCSGLRPKWRSLPRRIVDVGIFGHWIFLETGMQDYDVNPDEFDNKAA
ncbi:unnamed protein product [Soboliphyme baturini]|uniref:Lipase_3 domain-containing protein n=1 Tax=Soboliphyme baturini TaxID=241478 RepID=A0A183J2V6_9BILA|nr:unnamed protein product [Soboliphyme baturini]